MTLRPLPVPRLGFRPCGLRRRRWSIVGLAAFDSPFGPSSASRPSTRRSVRHPALQPSTRRSDCFSALRLRSSSRSDIRLATSPDPFRAPRSSLAVEPTTRPENHGGIAAFLGSSGLRFLAVPLRRSSKSGVGLRGTTASRFFRSSSTIAFGCFSLAGSEASCHGRSRFYRPFPSGRSWPETRDCAPFPSRASEISLWITRITWISRPAVPAASCRVRSRQMPDGAARRSSSPHEAKPGVRHRQKEIGPAPGGARPMQASPDWSGSP